MLDPYGGSRGTGGGSLFPGLARRHSRRSRRWSGTPVRILASLGTGLVLWGSAWLWMRSRSPDEPGADDPPAGMAEAPDPGALLAAPPPPPPLDLPELGASDGIVRELVGRLSSHPRLAAWLVSDELVRRFVVTVVRLAGGSSPASEVRFLAPEDPFQVREQGGRTVVDPASYRRYDLLTEAFASLDTEGAVILYQQLHPLFDEAYRELGLAATASFDETFALAVGNLLAVRVPAGPVEVVPDEAVWVYADPAVESRTEAAKHLMRMGPDNARRVQTKLAELAEGLGLPP